MAEKRYDISRSTGVQAGDHNLQLNVTNRLDDGGPRRRGWLVAITVLVVAGLGVGVAGLLMSRAGSEPRPQLELSAFTVQDPSRIDARRFEAGDPAAAEPTEVDTTAIDVTVKNNGDAPAVLTGLELTVRYVERLDDCRAEGGPVGVAAEYLVTLPEGDPATPFTVDRDIRFEVRGGAADRFTITVGPGWQSVDTRVPALIVADVVLRQDDGERLEAGTAAVVTQAGEGLTNFSWLPVDATDCIAANARLIEEVLAIPATRAREFAELKSRYARLARARTRPENTVCSTPPAGGALFELCGTRSAGGFEAALGLLEFPGDGASVTLRVHSPDGLVDLRYEWTWSAGWQQRSDTYQAMYLDAHGPGARTMSVVFTGMPGTDVLVADELDAEVTYSPGPAGPESAATVRMR